MPEHFILGVAFREPGRGDNIAQMGNIIANSHEEAEQEFKEQLLYLVTRCTGKNCLYCVENNLREI